MTPGASHAARTASCFSASELRAALRRLVSGGPVQYPVRPEILASWRRAVSQDLQPERAAPIYADRPTDPLLAVADPVLRALEQDVAGMDATVLLSDARGRIIARHGHDRIVHSWLDQLGVAPGFVWGEEPVGTNAIGTALAHRAAVDPTVASRPRE